MVITMLLSILRSFRGLDPSQLWISRPQAGNFLAAPQPFVAGAVAVHQAAARVIRREVRQAYQVIMVKTRNQYY